MGETRPDLFCVATSSDSHAEYAVAAMEAGADVFVEKPLAITVTDAAPVEVRGMGLRLSDEIAPDMYDYGHFQVFFADGSVGWNEAGWGPMMSDAAFFLKDIVSPKGAVSIRIPDSARSDDIDTHTKTSTLRVHRAGEGHQDLSMADEPGHQDLCDREQAFMARALAEDLDLTRHMTDAVRSLAVCIAADESVRSGKPVKL